MNRSIYHPIGPVGSILIGLVLCVLHFANITPAGLSLGWLGLAFLLGGVIMLMVRIMNEKKKQLK